MRTMIYTMVVGCMAICAPHARGNYDYIGILEPTYNLGDGTGSGGSAYGGYVRPAMTFDAMVVSPQAAPWQFPVHRVPEVNPATGTGSLSVGLFSWGVGGFPMSISLGYSIAGRTYDEKSGVVGLGWELSCTGTEWRDIVGLPDEYKTFRSLTEDEINALEEADRSTESHVGAGLQYLDNVNTRKIEATYDRYHYSFPGHSGSFIIKNGSIILLPTDNVTITRIGDGGTAKVKDFRITTPDGAVYEFTDRESTSYKYNSGAPMAGSLNYTESVSKWHLSRIITPEGADTITYQYAELPMWGHSRGHASEGKGVVWDGAHYDYTYPNSSMLAATSSVQTWQCRLLSKISSRTATVTFSHAQRLGNETE